MTASRFVSSLRTFVTDVAQGFFDLIHNGFALVGLLVILAGLTLAAQPEMRQAGEHKLYGWLQQRHVALTGLRVDGKTHTRATAADPKVLPKQQAAVTYWLSKKYRIAPEPLSALVSEAYEIGHRTRLDPTLILAVMAIESSFNPFAQSHVGAQGLMQVMTEIHSEKYEHFGGKLAAFDPVTNLRVGARVLQEYIHRTGSVEAGLRYYVGAANLPNDGGYSAKVLAEHARLSQVAHGRNVSPFGVQAIPVKAPDKPKTGEALALINS